MKRAYPVIMEQCAESIVAYVPDFNINAGGNDITEAIEMARDAIGIIGIDMEDDGEELPAASSLKDVQAKTTANSFATLVDVDFSEYRRKNDMRSVKKNVTIPSWLDYEAERAGVNFSAVLQKALKETLHITDR